RALVAEHDAAVEGESAVSVDHVQVAVADAGGNGAYQDLAAERPVDVDRFDAYRHVRRAADGSFDLHGSASLSSRVGRSIARQARSARAWCAGGRPCQN